MSVSLDICRKLGKALVEIIFKWVPNKTESIQDSSTIAA
jgi:hypothetical protein